MGALCAQVARHYDSLLRLDYSPDGYSVMKSLRMVLVRPVKPIIWADEPLCLVVSSWVASLISALAAVVLYVRLGWDARFVLLGCACIALILLACIDVRTWLLPDALTLPLLWLGLISAWAGVGISMSDSIAGIMVGYMLLAAPRLLWWFWTGQDGVGAGDLKLLAALGAWVGAWGIMQSLIVACLTGVLFAMVHQRQWRPAGAYPFGPFIALGGMAEILWQSGVQ